MESGERLCGKFYEGFTVKALHCHFIPWFAIFKEAVAVGKSKTVDSKI